MRFYIFNTAFNDYCQSRRRGVNCRQYI